MASRLSTALRGAAPALAALPGRVPRSLLDSGVLAAPGGAAVQRQASQQQQRPISTGRAAATPDKEAHAALEDSHLLQSILSGILAPYWDNTPTAEAVVGMLEHRYPEACIGFDHFAFRTFGVEGLGIPSVASLFTDYGYQQRNMLTFPKKKLRAYWYSPPDSELPRVFISEIKVDELSQAAQAVILKYVGGAASPALLGKYGMLSSLVGVQPWVTPAVEDYRLLAEESEYAAWVLVNGYALNHTTIAVHRLEGHSGGLEALNALLQEQGVVLNGEGGITKASPDGGLLQSSTVADRISYCFAEGETQLVPGSYIEFAERLVLPQYAGLKPEQVEERHRRDGFEEASADKIFESTTLAAQQ